MVSLANPLAMGGSVVRPLLRHATVPSPRVSTRWPRGLEGAGQGRRAPGDVQLFQARQLRQRADALGADRVDRQVQHLRAARGRVSAAGGRALGHRISEIFKDAWFRFCVSWICEV